MLIVAMLLPVFSLTSDGWALTWPELQGLSGPSGDKALMLYPLLAGIGMVLLSLLVHNYIRPLAVLGIALLGLILMLVSEEDVASESEGMMGVWFVLGAFALICAFVGLRIQRAVPASAFARRLAGVGGSLFLVLLVLPLLPREFGRLPLILPFKVMDLADVASGLVLLLVFAALIAAAVMACSTFGSNLGRNRAMATTTNRILLASVIVFPLLEMYVVALTLYRAEAIPLSAALIKPLLLQLKYAPLACGCIGILVVGVIDLYMVLPKDWFSRLRGRANLAMQRPTQTSGEGTVAHIESTASNDAALAHATTAMTGLRAELQQLQSMKQDGLISDADYEAGKKKLLDQMLGH